MDELSEFLRDSFYDQRRQVEAINKLVGKVLPVFVRFWDENAKSWPYELRGDDVPKVEGYSLSTTSMVLFSLAAVLGDVSQTVLVPALRKPPAFRTVIGKADLDEADVRKILDKSAATLIEKLKTESSSNGSPYLTDSKTYGLDDPFTLTWIAEFLTAYADVPSVVTDNVRAAAVRALNRILDVKNSLVWLKQPDNAYHVLDHGFIRLRGMQLYQHLREEDASNPDLDELARKIARTCEDRLHQQLSYFTVPDSRFDPAELAFCLEGALIFDSSYLGPRVIERVFYVLTECQDVSPYWRPLTPFIGTSRGMSLFPISVEVANSLLRSCMYVDEDALHNTVFEKFLPRFQRYADWLQARLVTASNPSGEFSGWHSEHVEEPATIHLWETSQVVIYLMHYAALLQQHGARSALVKSRLDVDTVVQRDRPYRLKTREPDVLRGQSPEDYWRECVEQERESISEGTTTGSIYRTFEVIRKNYVAPRSARKGKGKYTILLSGPPGTGKTSVCKEIAAALGWRFVTITVSDFLAGGAAEVEARAKAIFEMLNEQTKTVILMDEIDHFLLDRESRRYQHQEGIFQFMTPGMLTKLHRFREQQSSILIVATNFADRIDTAISRQGRLDDRLVLLPPDLSRRRQIIETLLLQAKDDKKIGFTAADLQTSDLDTLSASTVLLTYGEIRSFTEAALRELKNDSTADQIFQRLKWQADRTRPTITLESYRTRIEAQKNPDAAEDRHAPLEEFFLLVFLMGQASVQLKGEEHALIESAVRIASNSAAPKASDFPDIISTYIRDEDVARALAQSLTLWKVCA